MTELPDGSKTSFNVPAAIDAADLLRYYSFDLGGYPVEQLLGHWLTQYPADWIRLAVVEALYQGRYKAISVEQLLRLWQRRQQAFCHFNREFERLVCNKIPHQLNLASRSTASSQPAHPEKTVSTHLSPRPVILHLPGKQAISLLQTPAKIPPLRITPTANGSSASRLLNLVAPAQAASHPLPPFPVNHVDPPTGEPDRLSCQPVAELRTVIARPSLERSTTAAEPLPSASTAEAVSSESTISKPVIINSSASETLLPQTAAAPALEAPLNSPTPQQPTGDPVTAATSPPVAAFKSPVAKLVAERSPQTAEPLTNPRSARPPVSLPNPTALASPQVKRATERSLQACEPHAPAGVEAADARILPEGVVSASSSSESIRPPQTDPSAASVIKAAPPCPVTPIRVPPRVVELPIWQRIQSDPLLNNQLTSSDPAAIASQPKPIDTAQPDPVDTSTVFASDCSSLGASDDGKDHFLQQIRQGIRFSLDLGLTNRSMHPKLRLLLSQMYHLDWAMFDFNQPIHQFVPATDSPDFHGKLRAVAKSTPTEPINRPQAAETSPSTSHPNA